MANKGRPPRPQCSKGVACIFIQTLSRVTAFALFLIMAFLVCWIVPAAFEAKTFTKLTGKPVTTWDAMWIDLRVIEPASRGNRD